MENRVAEEEGLNDERRTYAAIQTIIGTMLEFDIDGRIRMLRTIATFFGIDAPTLPAVARTPGSTEGREVPAFSDREDLSPKDFLFQKKPKTDVERVACLAFYLTHYRNVAHFKTTDISKLNTEAAQIKLSNASNAVNNATRSGFLVHAAQGMKQISAPGEKFVDLLPDQASAKKAMSGLRPRRKRRPNVKDVNASKSSEVSAPNA